MRNSQGLSFTDLRAKARRERRETEVGNLILKHCHEHGLKADDFIAVPLARAILAYLELEQERDRRRLAPPSTHVTPIIEETPA